MRKFFKNHFKKFVSFISVLCVTSLFCIVGSAEELQSNGYDLHPLAGDLKLTMFRDLGSISWDASRPLSGNIYNFENIAQTSVDQITFSAISGNSYGFDILFNQVLYDYYWVVTVFADSSTSEEFTFYPNYMSCQTYPCDIGSKYYGFQDIVTKHFDTPLSRGFTIIGRMNRQITSSRVTQISMNTRDSELYYTIPANIRFSCSVIEVPKNSVTSSDITSIINAINNQTQSIIDNSNNNTEQLINNINSNFTQFIEIAGESEFVIDDDDNSSIDELIDKEDSLIADTSVYEDSLDVSIDLSANTTIWNIINQFLMLNPIIFALFVSMLTLGFIRLVLKR